ncbi:MAG: carbohydrate ABC transporter permease [Thermoleophilia bacterium]|nr:carbohydrate ABC transporter permease [Thermoleophilia bacterium]
MTGVSERSLAFDVLRVAAIAPYTVFLLLPLYWVVAASVKTPQEVLTDPPTWIPRHPTLDHFRNALGQLRGWQGIQTSLVVSVAATVFAVLIGTAAAYSIARFRTGGKHLSFWFLSQRILPAIAVVIPIFLLFSRYSEEWFGFALIATPVGLILVYTVFALPFTVWMMYAYFDQMPVELEEAALVDGCSRVQALAKIAWPLARPGVISAAAFAFIFSWTEFLFALVLTRDDVVTLPVVIGGLAASTQGSGYGPVAALGVLSLGPALVLGLFLQRHLVRGLTLGAVKG